MATSEPTDNDTYATALSQGYESQPLLTPINEQDDEEQSNENHHPYPRTRTRTDPVRRDLSDGPHQASSATADTRIATVAKCTNANPQVQDPIQILCKATHYELTNLGKALTCPICCSTYSQNSAVILPCVHAYCRSCIVQALRFKPECPTCKQPANKRSLVDCPVLNEMAIAYKQVARALGWSPSVYSSMVQMTQLPPPVHHHDDDVHDGGGGSSNSDEAEHVPLADCREQWQASKTWARVMEQEEDDDQNLMLREERRRVAQINEQAVARATAVVRRNKRQQQQQRNHEDADEVKKSVSFVADFKINTDKPEATARQGDDDVVKDQKPAATIVTPVILDTPTPQHQPDPSEMICINSNTTLPLPPCDVHDIRATAASCKHVQTRNEKDVVRDKIMEEGTNHTIDNEHRGDSVVSMPDDSLDDRPGLPVCEEVVVEQHQPPDDDFQNNADEGSDPMPTIETPTRDDGNIGAITVGSIVRVQSRTWPGINKPGGVARVTNVYADSHAYDVAYVLGGIEKRVGAAHITLEESNHSTAKRVRRGRDEIPVSLLQALARDGFDTARIGSTSAATKRMRKGSHKENTNPQISHRASDNSANSTTDTKKPKKRKDQQQDVVSPTTKKARAPQAEANLPELSHAMKCTLANDHYRTQIEASMKKGLLNVVVSSLPDEEQAGLEMLVGDAKHQVVKLKVQEAFNPKTTDLAIIPSESKDELGVARVRTLKAMRASLAGIPVVTPEWISHCRSKGMAVSPDSTMFIHSLPTKTNDLEDSLYGTALIAARLQQVGSGALPKDSAILPLSNVAVSVCGAFLRPPKADVQLLVKESGGTLQPSTVATIKLLQSASFELSGKIVVFLCDDSDDNAMCGITGQHARDIEIAIKSFPGRVLIVNAHWLFDVVTCGKRIPGNLFPPRSLRCNQLWSISCG